MLPLSSTLTQLDNRDITIMDIMHKDERAFCPLPATGPCDPADFITTNFTTQGTDIEPRDEINDKGRTFFLFLYPFMQHESLLIFPEQGSWDKRSMLSFGYTANVPNIGLTHDYP